MLTIIIEVKSIGKNTIEIVFKTLFMHVHGATSLSCDGIH